MCRIFKFVFFFLHQRKWLVSYFYKYIILYTLVINSTPCMSSNNFVENQLRLTKFDFDFLTMNLLL